MTQKNRAKGMIAASMAIFSTIGLFVRSIPVSSGELALYRAVMASLLIGGYLLVTKQTIPVKALGKDFLLLLVSGVSMGVNWILLFEAYKYTTVSAATLSYSFAPVLVTLVCPILFKERLTKKQAACFVMSTIGLALVIGVPGPNGNGQDHIGILLGLGAALFYATTVLLNKFIRGVDGIRRTVLQFLAAIVILIPYVACTGGMTLHTLNMTGWLCLLTVGLIHTGIAYCLYFSALNQLTGQEASILSYIDPLGAVLVSVLILSEPLTIPQLIGGILILGFTLLNELEPRK